MTKKTHDSILEKLREATKEARGLGYAVVYWNPEELKGVDPERIEERCVEQGNMVIDSLSFNPSDLKNDPPF
jgi:hypothetical protein